MLADGAAAWLLGQCQLTLIDGRPKQTLCSTIADVRSARHHTEMTITPAALAQLPLPDIRVVIFYKRDEITTDLICCDVEVAGHVWTFHEETAGWSDLIAHLSELPGFRADWYEAVVSPPFATNETVAFDRQ
jgi:hypothetical protein